eukprot:266930-Chlamydomonas_euryale.AAC.1
MDVVARCARCARATSRCRSCGAGVLSSVGQAAGLCEGPFLVFLLDEVGVWQGDRKNWEVCRPGKKEWEVGGRKKEWEVEGREKDWQVEGRENEWEVCRPGKRSGRLKAGKRRWSLKGRSLRPITWQKVWRPESSV